MNKSKVNLTSSQAEELKQSNQSTSSYSIEDNSKQTLPLEETVKEPIVILPSGKKFSKARYDQVKTALGLSGTLRMPDGMTNDGSDGYRYFWASTQFEGQVEKKQSLGYEICTDKKGKEYRHFASMDGNIRHEHRLMRIKLEDLELISEIQRGKKALAEIDKITNDLDSESVFENKTRLKKDGELTLSENLINKYNTNKIKQI